MPYNRRSTIRTTGNYAADKIVGLLPAALRPYAKAVVPAAVAAITVGVTYLATGHFDATAMEAAGGMAGAAIITLITPNH